MTSEAVQQDSVEEVTEFLDKKKLLQALEHDEKVLNDNAHIAKGNSTTIRNLIDFINAGTMDVKINSSEKEDAGVVCTPSEDVLNENSN